jgi:hypothetical protein
MKLSGSVRRLGAKVETMAKIAIKIKKPRRSLVE